MSAATKTRSMQRPVNLVLRGGGAHGAFATSAGALNAMLLADAMLSGYRETSREHVDLNAEFL